MTIAACSVALFVPVTASVKPCRASVPCIRARAALAFSTPKNLESRAEYRNYQYTREPEATAVVGRLEAVEDLQAVSFDMLLQALSESQKLPTGYEEKWTLACSDNMTLGRAAFADGTLARGNNRDLIEHYVRGWLEGRGCTDYEAIYDEEGRWIGYREK